MMLIREKGDDYKFYLAADVEPVLLKHCRLIRLLVDTGHKWDGYTLDYDEATRLLARLGE